MTKKPATKRVIMPKKAQSKSKVKLYVIGAAVFTAVAGCHLLCKEKIYEMGKDAISCGEGQGLDNNDHRFCTREGRLITGLVLSASQGHKSLYMVRKGMTIHETKYKDDVKMHEYDFVRSYGYLRHSGEDGEEKIHSQWNSSGTLVNNKKYYPNGKLYRETFDYDMESPKDDGKNIVRTYIYAENGDKLSHSVLYEEKRIKIVKFYKTNVGEIIETIENPSDLQGEQSSFTDTRDTLLNGDIEIYNSDGSVWQAFTLKNGSIDGKRTITPQNSDVVSEKSYRDGKLVRKYEASLVGPKGFTGGSNTRCGTVEFDAEEELLVGLKNVSTYFKSGKPVYLRCGWGEDDKQIYFCKNELAKGKTAKDLCKAKK